MLGLLPLASAVTRLESHRLPSCTRRRGKPRTYSDASIVLIALIARLWQLSTREVCLWLEDWPALAAACGLPKGQVIHPAHLSRRVKALGAYPFWLLYLVLVWRAICVGLIRGRDVIIDSTLLPAWSQHDPDAAWSFPSRKGHIYGYKVHVLLDRTARLPLCFLVSPANLNDLSFAYPLLWLARFVMQLPIHVVRADGAYWGVGLVRYIVCSIGAHPIIPFNRKRQRVVTYLCWPVCYGIRASIERFFAVAKRYYGLDTSYSVGLDAVLLRVTLTYCATLVVALAAQQAGAPQLRLSPTRVLAHYMPIHQAA